MRLNRIMLAAPKSGSGKTMITCALLQALKEQKKEVCAYKCGPDYIDPMFHQKVIDVPSKNLDTFFTEADMIKRLLLRDRTEEDVAVIEGVMGMYDGLGGVREEGSSYHLAEVTKTPIVLVVDAKGMGRSLIPMLAGFISYDKSHLIKGVILNRMSEGYYNILKPLMEVELGIRVLGYLPELKELQIESRHLGLKMPNEIAQLKEKTKKAAKALNKTVSIEGILELAMDAEELYIEESKMICREQIDGEAVFTNLTIAVAKDEAFCFYYEDNLELLKAYGAELVYFSPLHDTELPQGCNGILLGGGYPELYAEQLSENTSMRKSIADAISKGMPSVAECGGFMYLHEELETAQGKTYPMVGVIAGKCYNKDKLVRFGYIEVREQEVCFMEKEGCTKAHEFHYYDSTNNGEDCQATKLATGKSYPCVHVDDNHWWGFPHLYYPSNPTFAKKFVEKARNYQEK